MFMLICVSDALKGKFLAKTESKKGEKADDKRVEVIMNREEFLIQSNEFSFLVILELRLRHLWIFVISKTEATDEAHRDFTFCFCVFCCLLRIEYDVMFSSGIKPVVEKFLDAHPSLYSAPTAITNC